MNFLTSFMAVCTLVLGVSFSAPAQAVEKSDIEAGLRTLPLLLNKITGDTTIAIVYDPADAASVADAEKIEKIVHDGMTIPGGGKLSAMRVSVSELAKLSRVKVAFLTTGLGPHFTSINTATSAASILTISTDLDCVRAAKCIIGVATQPGVSIYYSKAAADSAKRMTLSEP